MYLQFIAGDFASNTQCGLLGNNLIVVKVLLFDGLNVFVELGLLSIGRPHWTTTGVNTNMYCNHLLSGRRRQRCTTDGVRV